MTNDCSPIQLRGSHMPCGRRSSLMSFSLEDLLKNRRLFGRTVPH